MDSKLKDVLEEFERGKLYGEVELKYVAGRIVLLRKTTTLVPDPKNGRALYEPE